MEYKIWIATYFNSPPPYQTETPQEEIERSACIWETEETRWRHIGTVDSLEAARYLVENDKSSYKDSEGYVYYLECEPDDELYYMFAKIEYGGTIEYYDRCSPNRKTRYARRFINL